MLISHCYCGFSFLFCLLPPNIQVMFKPLEKIKKERKYLLFCRFWFPRMFTTSVQPETKILFNFPSLQFIHEKYQTEKQRLLFKTKKWRVFFNLSNIKQSFTLNVDNFKRKGCDSIILLRKPSFFLVCSWVNNLKLSNS